MTHERWHDVCALDELVEGAGVGALVGGRQVALFQVHGRAYALDNFDPASRANVLSRGLTGNLQGERVVASPIYKNHFVLASGRCLEDPTFNVSAYPTRVAGGYRVKKGRDPLIERIEGSYSNVVGLPMEWLVPRLKSLALRLR